MHLLPDHLLYIAITPEQGIYDNNNLSTILQFPRVNCYWAGQITKYFFYNEEEKNSSLRLPSFSLMPPLGMTNAPIGFNTCPNLV